MTKRETKSKAQKVTAIDGLSSPRASAEESDGTTTESVSKDKRMLRLDQLLLVRYPEYSRMQIQSFIMQGLVVVTNDKGQESVITKSGTQVRDTVEIRLKEVPHNYVSRAGLKLEAALDAFDVDVSDSVVLDAGLSTGGFTDCLLARGARRVYGIDVGYGQVHEKLRQDPRLIIRERTNLRHLDTVGELVDLVTLDLSFISVTKVLDAVKRILKSDGGLIVLIKPQFEAQYHEIGKGGIVRDDKVREAIVTRTVSHIKDEGFTKVGVIASPIKGSSGNQEYLGYFKFS